MVCRHWFLTQYKYIDARRHMTGNIAHLSDFKDFDGGYVLYGEEASGEQIITVTRTIYGDSCHVKIIDDAQIEDTDELHDEDDATEESHDGSSFKENGTADQQVNTARPDINTGSREVSTTLPEVHTTTPEDLVGPNPASEDSHVEDQEIELGNIPQSYVVPTIPHTRIHKDHLIKHVSVMISPSFVDKKEENFLL
ncbi:hypothetical protein Tco_1475699 [Tanacetum coccineum]